MFCSELPEPILFHPLKHHLGFILSYILKNINTPITEINKDLKTLGTSQLDLYCGPLMPEHIAQEVITNLKVADILYPEKYKHYLQSTDKDYECVTLTDGTDWILRWGIIEGRYVHLHPARYATHTIRVKATALKTAITIALALYSQKIKVIDKKSVNQVRKEWLELAPVKSWNIANGAGKLLDMILTLLKKGSATM